MTVEELFDGSEELFHLDRLALSASMI